MGGLYGRYALKYINWTFQVDVGGLSTAAAAAAADDDDDVVDVLVVPNVFVTTATPHLRIKKMCYFNVPSCLEALGALMFGKSSNDLFRRSKINNANDANNYNDIIEQLAFDPEFIGTLSKFKKRIAYANAFSTDIAVTTATAAFLVDENDDENKDSCCSIANLSINNNDNDLQDSNNDSRSTLIIKEEEQESELLTESSHMFVSKQYEKEENNNRTNNHKQQDEKDDINNVPIYSSIPEIQHNITTRRDILLIGNHHLHPYLTWLEILTHLVVAKYLLITVLIFLHFGKEREKISISLNVLQLLLPLKVVMEAVDVVVPILTVIPHVN